MYVDDARQLRDRERGRRRHALALQSGQRKHREIRLARHSTPQRVAAAQAVLAALPGLECAPGLLPHSISVWYDIADHRLADLERCLCAQGFELDQSFYARLVRALVAYGEDTQRRNLRQPERLLKKSNEIYVKAWEQHPHGDCDETPPELRQNR